MTKNAAIDKIPSLPQVLVQIINVIHGDSADYQSIADIIRHDAAVTTRLITAANSSYFGRSNGCESIERALLVLGTDTVKTIAITASIKQYFGNFNQQHSQFLQQFWRRSLVAANFSQALATLTSYPTPEDAYLCGLLSNVGQLILLTSNEKQYLEILEQTSTFEQLLAEEQQQLGLTHCQLGADLIESWNIDGFMSDAVRYQHEPDDLIQDAHHLVKIVNLASLLSDEDGINDKSLATANSLFGLNESLTRELRDRIDDDVEKIASNLGIDINDAKANHKSQKQLGEQLSDLGQLAQHNSSLLQASNQESLQQTAQRALYLALGISDSVLFLHNNKTELLQSQPLANDETKKGKILSFTLPLELGRSLISDSFIKKQEHISTQSTQPLSVIDRQMVRYGGSDILVCWPLITQSINSEATTIGVLVFSSDEKQLSSLSQRSNLARGLCTEIANSITRISNHLENASQPDKNNHPFQHDINEAIHEVSNPLSIIRNYLEMLRLKLGDEHDANESLGLIKEEIARVGNILLRLKDPQETSNNLTSVDINSVIESISHIFKDSLFATKEIQLELNLDANLSETRGNPEHIKQILTNLLKNAAEALEHQGKISISSDAIVSVNGRNFCAINIEDNGPGISEEIKRHLFSPVTSTKGEGHSGLGLSIVNKLVNDMDGSIVCRSNVNKGTQFQILLPKP